MFDEIRRFDAGRTTSLDNQVRTVKTMSIITLIRQGKMAEACIHERFLIWSSQKKDQAINATVKVHSLNAKHAFGASENNLFGNIFEPKVFRHHRHNCNRSLQSGHVKLRRY